jgi:hypothetical protein
LPLAAAALAAGQPKQSADSAVARYKLEITDEPDKLRFALLLVSLDKRDICIDPSAWPDAQGKTQTGRDVYSMVTERETLFPHEPTVYIDCFDCETRIKRGKPLKGFIAYSEFDDPHMIRSRSKRALKVDIVPQVCEQQKRRREKRSNQAMQRTAGRSAFSLSMTSTFNLQRSALSPAVTDLVSR